MTPKGVALEEYEAAERVRLACERAKRSESAKSAAATRLAREKARPKMHVVFHRRPLARPWQQGDPAISLVCSCPYGGWQRVRSLARTSSFLITECPDCKSAECVSFWTTGAGCAGAQYVD